MQRKRIRVRYCKLHVTWYSMGISAYTCFAMVIVYMLASVVIFLKHKTTIAIIGAYLNLENPLLVRLQKQHDEMVMGFANLIRF